MAETNKNEGGIQLNDLTDSAKLNILVENDALTQAKLDQIAKKLGLIGGDERGSEQVKKSVAMEESEDIAEIL